MRFIAFKTKNTVDEISLEEPSDDLSRLGQMLSQIKLEFH